MKKVYITAAILAILAAISIYKFASYLEEKSYPKNEERVNVVVAVSNISKDTVLTQEMVKTISLPKESVLSDTFSEPDKLVGRIVTTPIAANEQILSSRTAAQGEKTDNRLSYELKEDEYAVTLNVSVVTGTAGYIKEGDMLTLTKISTGTNGLPKVDVLYEHVPVIRVSDNASRNSAEYATLTIVLPKKDVYDFIQYQESGVIRPVLESSFHKEQ